MKYSKNNIYPSLLEKTAFREVSPKECYPSGGTCWELSRELGGGYFWLFDSGKNYNIKIHDFWFHEDTVLNMVIPDVVSITYYDSISGEELHPYRQLKSNVVKSYLGGNSPFNAIIHRHIPIRSIGIEYSSDYYQPYFENNLSNYKDPREVFKKIDETSDFPSMIMLLKQIQSYRVNGIASEFFYDAKAAEALSLIYEYHLNLNKQQHKVLSVTDEEALKSLAAYIGAHYADSLTIELLARISCMGTTKLKKCFKEYYNSTLSDYITFIRIGQAEHLLSYTDLSIGQIAHAIGYHDPGYFSKLFKKSKGVLPYEFRQSMKR